MQIKYDIELTINGITNKGQMEIYDDNIKLYIDDKIRTVMFDKMKNNVIEKGLLKIILYDETEIYIKTVKAEIINDFIKLQKESDVNCSVTYLTTSQRFMKIYITTFIFMFILIALLNFDDFSLIGAIFGALLPSLFIAYIIFAISVIRDSKVIISALLIELSFICIYILKRKAKSLELTDIQLKWRKAFEYPDAVDKESNLFWRLKPKFSPHVKVDFKERVKGIQFFSIFLLLIWWRGRVDFISILVLIAFIKDLIYLLEVPLGLFTKTTGLCTGVVEKEYSKSRRAYYTVYITDYEKNNEIVFKVDNYCYIKERDTVTVIHGAISKKVINVEGMRLNVR